MSQSSQSKFLTGLVMGFLAGSTSYFLLNTDQGKKLSKQLKQKVKELQQEGFDFDQFKVGDLEISQLFEFLIEGKLDKPKKKKKIIRKVKKRSAVKKTKTPEKFSGV